MTNTTPILAIDIDGVLAPLLHGKAGHKTLTARGFRSVEWRREIRRVIGSSWHPYSELWLNPKHGEMLAKFSRDHDVELVWASMWEHNANRIIGPVLGLPRLPFVDFHGHRTGSGLWKFPAMESFAAGRPLAWLDDSFGSLRKVEQRRASGFDLSRRNLPTLLHEVDSRVGVAVQDLDAIAAWLKTIRLAWPGMVPTFEEPKPVVWQQYGTARRRGDQRRSTRRRFASAGTVHSSMLDEEFIDALALDGLPPF